MYLFNDKINVYWQHHGIIPQRLNNVLLKTKGLCPKDVAFKKAKIILCKKALLQFNKLIAHRTGKALMDDCS